MTLSLYHLFYPFICYEYNDTSYSSTPEFSEHNSDDYYYFYDPLRIILSQTFFFFTLFLFLFYFSQHNRLTITVFLPDNQSVRLLIIDLQ